MEDEVKISKITLDDNLEYYVLDKIDDDRNTYLFLSDLEKNVFLRKYETEKKDGIIYKLDTMEEMAHAFELFFEKHPELQNSLNHK